MVIWSPYGSRAQTAFLLFMYRECTKHRRGAQIPKYLSVRPISGAASIIRVFPFTRTVVGSIQFTLGTEHKVLGVLTTFFLFRQWRC